MNCLKKKLSSYIKEGRNCIDLKQNDHFSFFVIFYISCSTGKELGYYKLSIIGF